MKINTLNTKWWYRLVKVIFVLSMVFFCVLSVSISFFDLKPTVDYLNSKYSYKCNDGNIRGDLEYGYNKVYRDYGSDELYVVNDLDKVIRRICSEFDYFNSLNEEESLSYIRETHDLIPTNKFQDKNYEIIFKDKIVYGSWLHVFGASFLSLVVITLIAIILRFLFLYVLTGESKFVLNEIKK